MRIHAARTVLVVGATAVGIAIFSTSGCTTTSRSATPTLVPSVTQVLTATPTPSPTGCGCLPAGALVVAVGCTQINPQPFPQTHGLVSLNANQWWRYNFNAIAGNTYTFTVCSGGGGFAGDPHFELHDDPGCATYAWNADTCGLGPQILWTATFNGAAFLTARGYNWTGCTYTLAYWVFAPSSTTTDTLTPTVTFTATSTPTSTRTLTYTQCITQGWGGVAPMPTARSGAAAVAVTIGSVAGILVAGGGSLGAELSSALFYDPIANSWTPLAPMTTSRFEQSAAPATIGGAAGLLMAGGASGGGALSSAEFYNASAGTWTAVASMTTTRYRAAAAPVTMSGVVGVLVASGYVGATYQSSAEFYDPGANAWTAVTSMAAGRSGAAAASVTMGGVQGVLVSGGFNGSSSLSSTEFYNPIANTWTAVASMTTPRYEHSAAPVTIGGIVGVLAAGGNALSSAEFFNPGANSWTAVVSMTTARGSSAAAPVLMGGTAGVLAVGGTNGGALSSTEFFCP